MRFELRHDLPFVSVSLTYRGATVDVRDVLVDTGSASTILSADAVAAVGLVPEPTDLLRTLRGVGGREVVFTRMIDRIQVGDTPVERFVTEIGGMDYGFVINGILGTDFLLRVGGIVDFDHKVIEFPSI